MIPAIRSLARLGLNEGYVMCLGEGCKFCLGLRVNHPAAGDDHRATRTADGICKVRHLALIGFGATDAPNHGLEETLGIIIELGLHILAERQRHGAANGRIGHRCKRPRQTAQEMFRPQNSFEIGRDRTEAVVGTDGAVAEIHNLLQVRFWSPIGENIAWNA